MTQEQLDFLAALPLPELQKEYLRWYWNKYESLRESLPVTAARWLFSLAFLLCLLISPQGVISKTMWIVTLVVCFCSMLVRMVLLAGTSHESKNVGTTWNMIENEFSVVADHNMLSGLLRSKFWLRLIVTALLNGACIGVLWLNGYQWTAVVFALSTVVVVGFQLLMPKVIKRYLAAAAAVYAREFNIITFTPTDLTPDEPKISPDQINPNHPRPVLG